MYSIPKCGDIGLWQNIICKNIPNGIYLQLHFIHTMSKAEKTKAFIIEKTAAIFNKKGYAGTSLTDLTEATGLTKGALYGNFKNKDEIALAVYDYNTRIIKNNFLSISETGTGAVDQLLSIAEFYKKRFAAIAAHGPSRRGTGRHRERYAGVGGRGAITRADRAG